MKIKLASILITIAFAIGLISGAFIHRGYVQRQTRPVQSDTTIVQKHIDITMPEPAESHVDETPISVPVADLKPVPGDTTVVQILPEVKTYRDTLADGTTYTAIVSGVQPSLQSLSLAYPERTITNTVQKPFKGWTLSAEADARLAGTASMGFYAFTGVELAYNVGPFHVGVDAGLSEFRAAQGPWQLSPYIGARVRIDILRFR